MKILVSQNKTALFTMNGNQFINIAQVTANGEVYFSIGVENSSFALYAKEKEATKELKRLIEFLSTDTSNIFYFF